MRCVTLWRSAVAEPFSVLRLNANDLMFEDHIGHILSPDLVTDAEVEKRVRVILEQIRKYGDAGLIQLTNKFDRRTVKTMSQLEIGPEILKKSLETLSAEKRDALEKAAERIERYHRKQMHSSWQYEEDDGTVLGQKLTPLESVGIYVPGGKASYPSSVLMNAVPARVAGVRDITMVVPAPDNKLNPIVLAAAQIAGVSRVFTIGGAQAIAALAFGTQSVPKVDKIVGPGNAYVAEAKRMVFGRVGLDMIAGPSEILVICDGQTNPDWVAMDLFSQAEHDEDAQAILVSWDVGFIDQVQESIRKLLPSMPRREVIQASLASAGLSLSSAR